MSELLDLAHQAVQQALSLGADEAAVTVSAGSHATLTRRDGKVEQATEATTRGLSLSLFVDERSSVHSTSDLRPEALKVFMERAIQATRLLEPDPERRQPERERCGRGASEAELAQNDPDWERVTPEQRAARALALEQAVTAIQDDRVISSSTSYADGSSLDARVLSNGFADEHESSGFSMGAELTLDEGNGKRPEASAWYGARFYRDLPDPDEVAQEVIERAQERIGAAPHKSGRYPMILANRAAGRILGLLGAPLSGSSLYERRSCLDGKLGERIGSEHLTLLDDPTVPRGLGSRPFDGDALIATPRTIIEGGVLKSYYLGVYYARKLEMAPTTGGRSNWVVPAGERSWQDHARELGGEAILVNGFLGGNANPITGDFSFGIRGVLLEDGQPVRSVAEMNVSGNLLQIFHKLVARGDDPWPWSANLVPTLIFDDVDFSGT
ncbi:MAG: TldD/PmbA family protein [Deltaproteobacteria bacterium]|nr:MAG: TldD/PmbA family protein [Deltaproteobacteria bacterium]